ncbi:unnamed protein product [Calicophoron daubneyi]|uniref:SAM domain-containing protein n=1 Tax=Calicophoron daubneyi TaxID=300641 RepID=A0AAV2TPH6_CALDB
MADTEFRLLQGTDSCVDDSPPVCLVQLTNSKHLAESKSNAFGAKAVGTSHSPPNSTSYPSPEVSRSGKTTPDSVVLSRPSDVVGVSSSVASDTGKVEDGRGSVCNSITNSLPSMDTEQTRDSLAHTPTEESQPTHNSPSPASIHPDLFRAPVLKEQDELTQLAVGSGSSISSASLTPNPDTIKPANANQTIGMDEDDDIDPEDRPLTVDLPQEDDVADIKETTVDSHTSSLETVRPDSPSRITSVPPLPSVVTPTESSLILPAVQHATDLHPTIHNSKAISTRIIKKESQITPSTSPAPPVISSTELRTYVASRITTPITVTTQINCSTKVTPAKNARPNKIPISSATTPSSLNIASTVPTPVISIRSKPVVSHAALPTLSPAPSTTAAVTLTNAASATRSSQSSVHLMPFVATSLSGPANSPIALSGPTPALPLAGTTPSGGSLQIFNMTPVPQFVGTPSILLHATGPVVSTPSFQNPTPLVPGMPTVGATGLNGATLNFLQPTQPYATTLLPQPGGGSADFFIDPQSSIALNHQLGPSSSIALLNPVNASTSVIESFGAAQLSSIYPTIFQPHSHSLISTTSSASLFVSPNYRSSLAGATHLVNATAPQMATTLGSAGNANAFPGSNLSLSTPSGGSILLQAGTNHLIPSSFNPNPSPLLQSCQFPSFPIPFQTPDTCIPFTIAPTLPAHLSAYRSDDSGTISSSAVPNNANLWTSTVPISLASLHPAPTSTAIAPAVSTTNTLPHPPALQPSPDLIKRFQRLPKTHSKNMSYSRSKPGGNIGILTPNSTTVIPALRRRRGCVKTQSKSSVVPRESSTSNMLTATTDSHSVSTPNPVLFNHPTPNSYITDESFSSNTSTIAEPAITSSGQLVPTSAVSATGTDIITRLPASEQMSHVTEVPATPNDEHTPDTSKLPKTPTTSSPLQDSPSATCVDQTGDNSVPLEKSVDAENQLVLPETSSTARTTQPDLSELVTIDVPNSIKNSQPSGLKDSASDSSLSSTSLSPSSIHSSNQNKSHPDTLRPTLDIPLFPNGIHSRSDGDFHDCLKMIGISSSTTREPVKTKDSRNVQPMEISPVRSKSPSETSGEPLSRHRDLDASPVSTFATNKTIIQLAPPLLHHGPDHRRILTHFIDGHIIYESNKPFPVKHGMAVVEAALLHQCIEEENAALAANTARSSPLHLPSESKSIEEDGDQEPSGLESSDQAIAGGTLIKEMKEEKHKLQRLNNAAGYSVETSRRKGPINEKGLKDHPTNRDSLSLSTELPASGHFNGLPARPAIVSESPASFVKDVTACRSKSERNTSHEPPIPHQVSDFHQMNAHIPAHTNVIHRDDSSIKSVELSISRIGPSHTPTITSNAPSMTTKFSAPTSAPNTPTSAVVRTSVSQSYPGFFPPAQHPAPQQPAPPPPGPVRKWTPDDVVAFVSGTPGCSAYASAFLTNEIDGEALLLLAEDQFIQPPIGMKIGPALKLAARLESIRHIS